MKSLEGNNQRGTTVMELLVSLLISGLVFAGLFQQYTISVTTSYDHGIRLEAQAQAQAVLQTLTDELRIMGNGVPFDQANFQIGEDTLSDPKVTEPIDVDTASALHIAFRVNEDGEVHLLTQDFNPSSSLTISLTDVENLAENDPIYISNSVVAGDDGLYATIASVDTAANTITLKATPVFSPAAIFAKGSILEEVPLVTYELTDGNIVRNSGYGEVVLASNAALELDYLDFNGTELSLPISNVDVVNSLRSIRITITVNGTKPLSNGETYTVSAQQLVGLRNLNYFF